MKTLRYYLNGTLLEYSPDGWDDNLINRVRNDNYHGISEKFTTPFSFVRDGAAILRNLFYTDGFEASCTFAIEQLNGLTLQYASIFSGVIDFSTFVDQKNMVQVSISESSIWEIIKANEETEYEIDIDTNDPVQIEATFPYIQQSMKCTSEGFTTGTAVTGVGFSTADEEMKVPTLAFTARDNENVVNGYDHPFIEIINDTKDFVIRIYGSLLVSSPYSDNSYLVRFWDIEGGTPSSTDIASGSVLAGVITSVHFDQTINLGAYGTVGKQFALEVSRYNCSIGYPPIHVDFDYLAKVPDATIQALTPKTVFEQLLTKMNGGTVIPYYATFLESISNYLLTSGDAIRGLASPKIKTSFKDFFDSLNAIFCVGIGVETISTVKTLVMDNIYRFYNIGTEIANIGEVSDLEVSVMREKILSALKVGYQEQTYDDVNGKYEPNQFQEWSFPIKKVAGKGEQISKYRADVFGITSTSLNLEGKVTTDADSDSDVFIMHTVTTEGITTFNREFEVSSVQGFPDPAGLFNTKLTPKRCLGRHLRVYTSFMKGLEAQYITFQSASKNKDLVVNDGPLSIDVVEREDLLVGDLSGTELYLPYLFSFRKDVANDFNSLISANLHGYITFTWKGNTYTGFIQDIGINPGKNTEYTYKLIATSINDLSTLIR